MSTAPELSRLSTLALRPDDLQPDAGVLVVKFVQIRRQELPRHRVTGADGQGTQQQLLGLRELVLAGSQQTPRRCGHTDRASGPLPSASRPGTAGKQPGLQGPFPAV